jgi:hypothetical protein
LPLLADYDFFCSSKAGSADLPALSESDFHLYNTLCRMERGEEQIFPPDMQKKPQTVSLRPEVFIYIFYLLQNGISSSGLKAGSSYEGDS